MSLLLKKVPARLPRSGALLRRHFFAGLLVVIPLGVIAWIIGAALGALWRLHGLLPLAWRPENFMPDPALATLVNVCFTLVVALALAVAISMLGWASKNYFGQKILEIIAGLIQRIPVVRSVYSALDQLLRALAAGGGKQFSRVVYVEFPRKGAWTLAFVTGAAESEIFSEPHLNLFVPATPNPTSGFYLIVPASEVRESGLRVEEAFKVILSLGIAHGQPGAARRDRAKETPSTGDPR